MGLWHCPFNCIYLWKVFNGKVECKAGKAVDGELLVVWVHFPPFNCDTVPLTAFTSGKLSTGRSNLKLGRQ